MIVFNTSSHKLYYVKAIISNGLAHIIKSENNKLSVQNVTLQQSLPLTHKQKVSISKENQLRAPIIRNKNT